MAGRGLRSGFRLFQSMGMTLAVYGEFVGCILHMRAY